MKTTIEQFWNAFLIEKKLDIQTRYLEAFSFGCTRESANALLQLVLDGKKKATCSSVRYYEVTGDRQPQVGDYSIVCNSNQKPCCVIKTTQTVCLPFCEMTYEICKREGEDTCLETWVNNHERFFQQDALQSGYKFSDDMLVLFEDFEVVYR